MKKISRNKQKDKRPLAGLFAIKHVLVIPAAVFAVIVSGANIIVTSTI